MNNLIKPFFATDTIDLLYFHLSKRDNYFSIIIYIYTNP